MNAWRRQGPGTTHLMVWRLLTGLAFEQAAHSCQWVLKPVLHSSSPAALVPQALISTAPRNETQGMQGIVNKACINQLTGNWLKIKALRLVVSLRLQSLAALGAASERVCRATPRSALCCVGGGTVHQHPRSNNLFLSSTRLCFQLSSLKSRKSDSTSTLTTMLIQSSLKSTTKFMNKQHKENLQTVIFRNVS